ncbi:universal stress protein [Deinococcus sp. KSM4-11]|uniref:universal stress protein n=1 Tax=Deinococcus sp. KSM4-11 TaxID=2568654 RepID=UPI0010A3B837|nr:universal stress protein [Deinococcus sp. KSM4-11]THF87700.1 universal stress protein [Deinococcus sp. KSM4-11]
MTQTPSSFQKILVGVDFSDASRLALQTARTRFPGAQLKLAHVTDARAGVTPDLMGGVTPTMPDPSLLDALEDADAGVMSRLVQPGEETVQLVGDPLTGILDAAEAWGADLIVVGTHQQGLLEHFLLGSTAEKLVARSRIPVLTVRHG